VSEVYRFEMLLNSICLAEWDLPRAHPRSL